MAFPKIEKQLVKATHKVLGREITYSLQPENIDLEIKGIFDSAFIEVNGVSSIHPILNLDLGLLPRYPSIKDEITIDTIVYRVLDPRQDGVGGCIIILKR